MHASARLIKVDKVSRTCPEDRACGRIPFQDTFKPEQILICSGFFIPFGYEITCAWVNNVCLGTEQAINRRVLQDSRTDHAIADL